MKCTARNNAALAPHLCRLRDRVGWREHLPDLPRQVGTARRHVAAKHSADLNSPPRLSGSATSQHARDLLRFVDAVTKYGAEMNMSTEPGADGKRCVRAKTYEITAAVGRPVVYKLHEEGGRACVRVAHDPARFRGARVELRLSLSNLIKRRACDLLRSSGQ